MTEARVEHRIKTDIGADRGRKTQSYKSLQVDFYDGLQPTTLTAELVGYPDGEARWAFRLYDRSTGSATIVLACDFNELVSLILLGKTVRDSTLPNEVKR